ncbi:MAG: PQQ-dependent sugar dehydrogenase [Ignavibacteriales bacterium]|nr:PQQ-dependent sugar dehydrogenase [Ignavibacteriales bacterium]
MRTQAILLGILVVCGAPGQSLHAQILLQSAFPNLSFIKPLDLQSPPDGTNRIAVVTQPGVIYIFPNAPSVSSANVFLDVRDSVHDVGSEQGLLGLAFHPRFAENRYLFVNYTSKPNARTVIARYTVSNTNPDSVDKSTRLVILEIYQPFSNHNGGGLAFGPDGYLYIGTGDGGSGGDPANRAQNLDSLLGKMLRIDVDGSEDGRNYAIPPTNPYFGMTSPRPEIWAYGLRNPWRYSFDSTTGWLWAADVGQDAWEEIDIIEKGKNYGWRIMEGLHCYNPSTGCNQTGLTLPIWEYAHNSAGGFSITGGFVYRGAAIPELYGKYVYGDYVSRRIWFLSYDGVNPPVNELFGTAAGGISSFGLDQDKELYVTAFDGKIYKFIWQPPTSAGRENPVQSYSLRQNYPNPFNPGTTIEFSLPTAQHTTVTVYDMTGKEILTLANTELSGGVHRIHWDGRDMTGKAMPSGVYFYRLKSGARLETGRMMLLR